MAHDYGQDIWNDSGPGGNDDATPPPEIRFEGNAMMGAAHLSHADGGKAWVFCSIPGGRPWMSMSIRGDNPISITNAPQCGSHGEFKRFVKERFG
jgi:hypothetical protein